MRGVKLYRRRNRLFFARTAASAKGNCTILNILLCHFNRSDFARRFRTRSAPARGYRGDIAGKGPAMHELQDDVGPVTMDTVGQFFVFVYVRIIGNPEYSLTDLRPRNKCQPGESWFRTAAANSS